MSSCKKEYTCTCKYDQGGVSAEVSYTFEAKKSDAEDACNAYVSTAGSGYVTSPTIAVAAPAATAFNANTAVSGGAGGGS